MAEVTKEPTNDPNTPATSPDVPANASGEAEAANDTSQAAITAIGEPLVGEVTVKEDQTALLASQAGLSLNPGQSLKLVVIAEQDVAPDPPPAAEKRSLHPQQSMANFWLNFTPDYEGMVTQVLPDSLVRQSPAKSTTTKTENSPKAGKSYDEAKADCIRAVKRIIRECQGLNMKYSDPHFDIERDLKISGDRDCLDGLLASADPAMPADVKRVTDLFTDPKFFEDGATSDDIRQGINGDCWFLSALSALCSNEELIRKVCVIQSQAAGVYGFVFHRDGEWQQCVIDDKLYLRAPAYDESGDLVVESYNLFQKDPEAEYTKLFQTGSKALLFAQSTDQNETWVPLLEKAFAKAHGDYAAIEGGQTGEAIEDLTGGVTTEIYTTNILSKDDFWKDELSKVGNDFLFSCGLAIYKNWRRDVDDSDRGMISRAVQEQRQSGLVSGHAYAVLATYEGFGERLVKVRNPWGHEEWNGPWSDGSKEWTDGDGDWAKRLNHKFGDDGVFWMSYSDFLKRYVYIDRTRIFDSSWHVAHEWTSIQVPWSTADYHDTKFSISVPAATAAVIVLSQLDVRYYRGLQGKYEFNFHFRVQKDADEKNSENGDPDDYLARSRLNYELSRSVNVEVNLEPGTYTVLMKVEAEDVGRDEPETVIRNNIARREKVIGVGISYDLAHRKGLVIEDKAKDAGGKTTEPTTADKPADAATTASPSKDDPTPPLTDPAPDPEDPARKPWNASTVVGLKVYSKLPELSISVIKPAPPPADESSPLEATTAEDAAKEDPAAQEQAGEAKTATLDGDDAAKAALDQAATGKVDSLAQAPAEAATPAAELPIRVDLP